MRCTRNVNKYKLIISEIDNLSMFCRENKYILAFVKVCSRRKTVRLGKQESNLKDLGDKDLESIAGCVDIGSRQW
jgi:hypothetical protein